MLIDQYLPAYEFSELHSVIINAPPERAYTALKELTVADLSPLIFLLLDIRSLPGRIIHKGGSGSFHGGPFLEQLYQGGFIPLGEMPGEEIVFGLIGQFWKLFGGVDPQVPDAPAFLTFDDPAFAKVAANLAISVDENGRTRCLTETRIHVPERSTRRKFAFYWRVISMGSAIIRRLWLRAIKRKAERG